MISDPKVPQKVPDVEYDWFVCSLCFDGERNRGDISEPGGRQMHIVYYSDVKIQALPDSVGLCTKIMTVVNLSFGNLPRA